MTFDGDPKLYDTGDGADLVIAGGQPEMDEGLENAAYLSLFTPAGYWGNSIANPSERFSGRMEELNRRTLTNATRLDAEEYARAALAWMVADGIARSITVAATIPGVGVLGLTIEIEQPERTSTIRYLINWQTMEIRKDNKKEKTIQSYLIDGGFAGSGFSRVFDSGGPGDSFTDTYDGGNVYG